MTSINSQRSIGDAAGGTGAVAAGISVGFGGLIQGGIFGRIARPGALVIGGASALATGTAIDFTNRNGRRNSWGESAAIGAGVAIPATLMSRGASAPIRVDELRAGLRPAVRKAYPAGVLPHPPMTAGKLLGVAAGGAIYGAILHTFTND